MPELPEVETVRRGLNKILRGDKIISAQVLRRESIASPDVDSFIRAVRGHTFEQVERRGKYLLLDLDGGAGLACHLRMSGRLIVRKATATSKVLKSDSSATATGATVASKSRTIKKSDLKDIIKPASSSREPKFVRVVFYLESGRELHFEDMRVFGRLWFKPKGEKL